MKETERFSASGRRDSNLELLRIVSMFMILCHHFIVHGMGICAWLGNRADGNIQMAYSDYAGSSQIMALLFSDAFVICGVNLFILISGYYGIKLSWERILKFVLILFFFQFLQYGALLLWEKESFTIKGFIYQFLPVSHTPYWFMYCYFQLMLISPLLNTAIEHFSDKLRLGVLYILGLITVYWGWLWSGAENPYGYSLFQFVFIYYTGKMIRLEIVRISEWQIRGGRDLFFRNCIGSPWSVLFRKP